MNTKWKMVLISWMVSSIALIYLIFPLPENSGSLSVLILVPVCGLLIIALMFGIMKELQGIFGSKWRRPFFLFGVAFYLLGNALFWLPPNSVFNIKVSSMYKLLFFLLLPICYATLVIYRKFLQKETIEGRNE